MKVICAILLFITSQSLWAQEEWTSLYNGTDMEGWNHVGEGKFLIEDGLLKTEGGMGLLWYTGEMFENV